MSNKNRTLSEDELDEYEYSEDDNRKQYAEKTSNAYVNKPYDEAYELSQDMSAAESYGHNEKINSQDRSNKNDNYNLTLNSNTSLDNEASAKTRGRIDNDEKSAKTAGYLSKESSKTQSISNRHFDEAYEMSQSTSEDSIDTQNDQERVKNNSDSMKPSSTHSTSEVKQTGSSNPSYPLATSISSSKSNTSQSIQPQGPILSIPQQSKSPDAKMKLEESSDGEHDESYDNLEGAYNPKDYLRLAVSSDVKDLFQYISRYKSHEVELESSLKCFIPEYIPSVGEIDSFLKIPRPDGKDDDLGFKVLDEPSLSQSDPSVLELQLKSITKKLQYGDVAVRSIENASKNPAAIDKWIQNVLELHRTKPPPHVTYKKNMPDIETLMEVWPEDFEAALKTNALPSPDLDLSLNEYVRVTCALLDIPVYDNPIESLHLLFSLYSDFRNNPHFQARAQAQEYQADSKNGYGGADVLEIDPGYK